MQYISVHLVCVVYVSDGMSSCWQGNGAGIIFTVFFTSSLMC